MTSPAPETPKFSLAAHAEERVFAPIRRRPAGFAAAIVVVLLLHAAIIAAFLYRDAKEQPPPPPEETPVEVVMEQPKPPPQQPPPPPPPKPKNPLDDDDDRPAFSSPRKSEETVQDRGHADKSGGPKSALAPQDGKVKPDAARAPPPPAKAAEIEKKSALEDDQTKAEALDKASPHPDKTQEEARSKPRPRPAAPDTGETEATAAGRANPGPPSLASAVADLLAPGTDDNRYNSILFDKVMSKKRYAGSVAERRGEKGRVVVVFDIAFDGQLVREQVSVTSGIAALDALAMNAVRSAAPFPPPPGMFGGRTMIVQIVFP